MYAVKAGAYDALSAYQITKFFKEHRLARDEADLFASELLGCPVSATPMQGATSYTVSGTQVAQVVQFRSSQLSLSKIETVGRLYAEFVPRCQFQGMFGSSYVYVADLVPGPAFCRVRNQFFSLSLPMEQRLQQTVQDLARCVTISDKQCTTD